jgi:hypothetical protein
VGPLRRDLVPPFLRRARSLRSRRAVGVALRLAAPFVAEVPAPRAPIFIVGAPRSGTTLLFELLDRCEDLASLHTESQVLWDAFHAIDRDGWRSHELGPDDVMPHEPRLYAWAIDAIAGERRYLDKLPRNCLRIPYLQELFPDATFVLIRRDGRDTVSSMITGWREGTRFGRPDPPPVTLDIEGYGGRTWNFVMPRGWRDHTAHVSLEEVCAFQWSACVDAIVAARERIPPGRWVEVAFEELVAEPVLTARWLLDGLHLPHDADVLNHAGELDGRIARSVVSAPRPGKWRDEHPAEIERVLPRIAASMERLGYADGSSLVA